MSNSEKDNVENEDHASLINYNRTANGHDFVHDNVTRYVKQFEQGKFCVKKSQCTNTSNPGLSLKQGMGNRRRE